MGCLIRQDGSIYIDYDMLLERPVKKTGYLIISCIVVWRGAKQPP